MPDNAKPLLSRTPVALAGRGLVLVSSLLISRHPTDLYVWLRSMLARRRLLSYPVPWLTFDAIRMLNERVGPGSRVFEYGAGNSTLYWAARGATVHAVDNDPGWFSVVSAHLVPYGSRAGIVLQTERNAYVGAIDSHERGSFDVVLVDGIHRRECLAHAVPFVKPGGLLVLDNSDWHWFRSRPVEGVPPDWRRSVHAGYAPMLGHPSETTIWQAPG